MYQDITLAQIKLKTVGGNSITESIIGSPSSPRKAATVIPLALNRKIVFKVYFVFGDETVSVPLLLQKELQNKKNYKSSLAIL